MRRGGDGVRQKIIDECIRLFNEKGCRFTLDDIVAGLHISRKTIYKYFLSKDDILYSMLEETMAGIRAQQRRLALDETLPTREKLRRALTIDTKYEHEIKSRKILRIRAGYPRRSTGASSNPTRRNGAWWTGCSRRAWTRASTGA
jgi:AcrR family transcriptional regulator